ncbi:uncharacterized protein LOC144105249 [Amblyomma americanum]
MSTSSPGQGNSPWSASLPPNKLSLDALFRGGVGTIPVALAPSDGGAIRLNNQDAVQTALRAITPHFLKICDVRQYGRGGVVCRSTDQACIMDLLTCTAFGSQSLWCRRFSELGTLPRHWILPTDLPSPHSRVFFVASGQHLLGHACFLPSAVSSLLIRSC